MTTPALRVQIDWQSSGSFDDNLCDNPSFEAGLSGWSAAAGGFVSSGASAVQAADAPGGGGSSCAEVAMSGGGDDGLAYRVPYAFRAGVAYTVAYWVKSVSGGTSFYSKLGSAAAGDLAQESAYFATGSWQLRTLTWTPTADRRDVDFAILHWGGAASTVRIDLVSVSADYTSKDVTASLDTTAPATWERGRNADYSGDATGAASFTLDNSAIAFSGSSAPRLLPGIPVLITSSYLGTTYAHHYGFVERVTPIPWTWKVNVTTYDPIKRMASTTCPKVYPGSLASYRDARRLVLEEFARGSLNLLYNPAFAADTAGWPAAGSSSITRVTGESIPGIAETTAAELTGFGFVGQVLSLAMGYPADTYRVSFYARSVSGYGTIDCTPYIGGVQAGSAVLISIGGAWQRYSYTFTTASLMSNWSPTYLAGGIALGWSVSNGQAFRVAGVMATRGPELLPYDRVGVGRAQNFVNCADFDLAADPAYYGWQPAFRNMCGNPSFEVDASGWSVAGDAFTTPATAIGRAVGATPYGSAYATIIMPAGTGHGAFYAVAGTLRKGHTYVLSVYNMTGDGSPRQAIGIGSQSAPWDKAEWTASTVGRMYVTWTPLSDVTDAHIYLRWNLGSVNWSFDAVCLAELGWPGGVAGTSDWFASGPQGGILSGPPEVPLGDVDGTRSVWPVKLDAAAGSGVAYWIGARLVGGQTYQLGIDLRASAACSVGIGISILKPGGAGAFEEASAIVAATTSWQRASVSITPSATHLNSDGSGAADAYICVWANDATGAVVELDAVRLAPEQSAQPFAPPGWVSAVGTESAYPFGGNSPGNVASVLAALNGATGSSHYVTASTAPPFWQYHVLDIAQRNALASLESFDNDFSDLTGTDLASESWMNTIAYTVPGYPGPVTAWASDGDSVAAHGVSLGAALSSGLWVNADPLAALLAADKVARYKDPAARPTMLVKSRFPSQLEREVADCVTVALDRLALPATRHLIVRAKTTVAAAGRDWRTEYGLEQFAPPAPAPDAGLARMMPE